MNHFFIGFVAGILFSLISVVAILGAVIIRDNLASNEGLKNLQKD